MSVVPPQRVRVLQHGWGGFVHGAEVEVVAVDVNSINGLICFKGGKRTHLATEGIVWKRVSPFAHPHVRCALSMQHATTERESFCGIEILGLRLALCLHM